jgi:hypothetical protein
VLFALFGAAVVTLVAGVFVSPLFLAVHLVIDAALAGFVWMLVTHRRRIDGLRSAAMRRDRYEAAPILRRRASGS